MGGTTILCHSPLVWLTDFENYPSVHSHQTTPPLPAWTLGPPNHHVEYPGARQENIIASQEGARVITLTESSLSLLLRPLSLTLSQQSLPLIRTLIHATHSGAPRVPR